MKDSGVISYNMLREFLWLNSMYSGSCEMVKVIRININVRNMEVLIMWVEFKNFLEAVNGQLNIIFHGDLGRI